RCVNGIQANVERARRLLDESTALVTALTPVLGYAQSSEIAKEALATGKRVYDLVLAKKLMTKEQLDQVLRPEFLTKPSRASVVPPKPCPSRSASPSCCSRSPASRRRRRRLFRRSRSASSRPYRRAARPTCSRASSARSSARSSASRSSSTTARALRG